MTTTSASRPRGRLAPHRLTCVAAGGLTLLGGALGLFVSPWFLTLAIAGGVWLIAAGLWGDSPEPTVPVPPPTPVDPGI